MGGLTTQFRTLECICFFFSGLRLSPPQQEAEDDIHFVHEESSTIKYATVEVDDDNGNYIALSHWQGDNEVVTVYPKQGNNEVVSGGPKYGDN